MSTAMCTITIQECPLDVQKLWKAAEATGYSGFFWSSDAGLFGYPPNATDRRVPVRFDMFEEFETKYGRVDPRAAHTGDNRQAGPL